MDEWRLRQHATPTGGSVQYADLGEWQHAIMESDDAKPGRDYWRQQQFGFASLNLDQGRTDGSEPLI